MVTVVAARRALGREEPRQARYRYGRSAYTARKVGGGARTVRNKEEGAAASGSSGVWRGKYIRTIRAAVREPWYVARYATAAVAVAGATEPQAVEWC